MYVSYHNTVKKKTRVQGENSISLYMARAAMRGGRVRQAFFRLL